MSFEFEWDDAKAKANLKKHGVAFDEVLSVFGDPSARIFDDPDHSEDEPREIAIGFSTKPRLLLVGFTGRSGRVRLIHARAQRRSLSDNAMKKTSSRSRKQSRSNRLRTEYEFNYSRSRPNRFASRLGPQTVAVVLEPDVAQVFDSSRAVNKLLRSVIAAAPTTDQTHRGSRRKAG